MLPKQSILGVSVRRLSQHAPMHALACVRCTCTQEAAERSCMQRSEAACNASSVCMGNSSKPMWTQSSQVPLETGHLIECPVSNGTCAHKCMLEMEPGGARGHQAAAAGQTRTLLPLSPLSRSGSGCSDVRPNPKPYEVEAISTTPPTRLGGKGVATEGLGGAATAAIVADVGASPPGSFHLSVGAGLGSGLGSGRRLRAGPQGSPIWLAV